MEDNNRITKWTNEVLDEISKLNDKKGFDILEKCGASCCKESELYKGAVHVRNKFPPGTSIDQLFTIYKKEHYNTSRLTKTGNTITLVFEKCTCPLVKEGVSNSYLCHCTVGYTKTIFETLFDHKVEVKLEKSILRGDKICKQTIKIND